MVSDRMALIGLAFGAFVLAGAALGLFAYELGRVHQSSVTAGPAQAERSY